MALPSAPRSGAPLSQLRYEPSRQAVAGVVRSLELEANIVSLQCYANAIPQLLQMMGLMMVSAELSWVCLVTVSLPQVKHLKQLMPRVCEWVGEARHHPLLSTAGIYVLNGAGLF